MIIYKITTFRRWFLKPQCECTVCYHLLCLKFEPYFRFGIPSRKSASSTEQLFSSKPIFSDSPLLNLRCETRKTSGALRPPEKWMLPTVMTMKKFAECTNVVKRWFSRIREEKFRAGSKSEGLNRSQFFLVSAHKNCASKCSHLQCLWWWAETQRSSALGTSSRAGDGWLATQTLPPTPNSSPWVGRYHTMSCGSVSSTKNGV